MEKQTSPINSDFENDDNPLIHFDFQTGKFDLKSIHPSLKKIFKTLGISKKDLKDKRMVPVIFDALIKAFSELHLIPTSKKTKKELSDPIIFEKELVKGKDFVNCPKNEECMIKFDMKQGIFEIENLHHTLKRIFQNAGITKKDLRNKEMAITILHSIIESFCEINSLHKSQEMMKSGELLK